MFDAQISIVTAWLKKAWGQQYKYYNCVIGVFILLLTGCELHQRLQNIFVKLKFALSKNMQLQSINLIIFCLCYF